MWVYHLSKSKIKPNNKQCEWMNGSTNPNEHSIEQLTTTTIPKDFLVQMKQ